MGRALRSWRENGSWEFVPAPPEAREWSCCTFNSVKHVNCAHLRGVRGWFSFYVFFFLIFL